ncbi:hypothetical protein B0H14DRAFT_3891733 [Mycena olivaceomarginata]|nr:hypothetical protein B0H14DRAFT_3891733 [Mycena olivaceomarginata]
MLALSVSSLVVLVTLAVPAVSLTNTSIPHIPDFHTIPPQPSTWQELAHSHNYMPLILLASALGWFIGSSFWSPPRGVPSSVVHSSCCSLASLPPGPSPSADHSPSHSPPTSPSTLSQCSASVQAACPDLDSLTPPAAVPVPPPPPAMPARNDRTAPVFDSQQPRNLPKYFSDLGFLLSHSRIADDSEKKYHATRAYWGNDTSRAFRLEGKRDASLALIRDSRWIGLETFPIRKASSGAARTIRRRPFFVGARAGALAGGGMSILGNFGHSFYTSSPTLTSLACSLRPLCPVWLPGCPRPCALLQPPVAPQSPGRMYGGIYPHVLLNSQPRPLLPACVAALFCPSTAPALCAPPAPPVAPQSPQQTYGGIYPHVLLNSRPRPSLPAVRGSTFCPPHRSRPLRATRASRSAPNASADIRGYLSTRPPELSASPVASRVRGSTFLSPHRSRPLRATRASRSAPIAPEDIRGCLSTRPPGFLPPPVASRVRGSTFCHPTAPALCAPPAPPVAPQSPQQTYGDIPHVPSIRSPPAPPRPLRKFPFQLLCFVSLSR